MSKTKEEKARSLLNYITTTNCNPSSLDQIQESFTAGYTACESIKATEIVELKEQLRWRSFTKDKLPTIGMTIISKRKNNDEYDITFLKNHDVIHYLCETAIEWLSMPRKEEE